MTEDSFWQMIEDAWKAVGGKVKVRQRLAQGKLSDDQALDLADEDMPAMIEQLHSALDQLPADELLAFDRILERKLYDIDRADVQAQTDGSDDGFLYCRGFIVAAGRDYYNAVNADPTKAIMDAECEEMCYISYYIYEEKFGDVPDSGISRETCSNTAGWPQQ